MINPVAVEVSDEQALFTRPELRRVERLSYVLMVSTMTAHGASSTLSFIDRRWNGVSGESRPWNPSFPRGTQSNRGAVITE